MDISTTPINKKRIMLEVSAVALFHDKQDKNQRHIYTPDSYNIKAYVSINEIFNYQLRKT